MEDNEEDKRDELSPEEELNAENEMELLRLNLEYGAQSFIDDDAPPELVSMFLDQIRAFENRFKNGSDMTTIRESLGEGFTFVATEDIRDDQMEDAIEELLEALDESGIMIDRPEHLTARQYHHFLTHEFLDQAIMDNRPPGFIAGYIYDEIHMDDPKFIVENAESEILNILNTALEYDHMHIAEEVEIHGEPCDFLDLLDEIYAFRHFHRKISDVELALENVHEKSPNERLVTFDLSYKSTNYLEEQRKFEGYCIVHMILDHRDWCVRHLVFPGLRKF